MFPTPSNKLTVRKIGKEVIFLLSILKHIFNTITNAI